MTRFNTLIMSITLAITTLSFSAHASQTVTMTINNGRHVVFGKVVKGMSVVKKIESYGSASGLPSATLTISACKVD